MVHTLKFDIYERIYKNILYIRAVEERIAKEYINQEIRCPTHLSIGQELVPAIANIFFKKNDYVVSTHRSHAHYLSKGGDLEAFIAELYGKSSGCSKGIGGSMHLIDKKVNFMGSSAIVGNSIPLGVGLGESLILKNNKDNVSVIFLGDGATEEGVFYESLNYSVVKNLPVLFICENNFFSVYSPLSVRQPKNRKISAVAKSIGVKSFFAKNNNINQYYKIIKNSFDYVRKNRSPAFIELETFRYLEHCGYLEDDSLSYRPPLLIKDWKKRDPLKLLDRILKKNNALFNFSTFNLRVQKRINEAFFKAKKDKPLSYSELELFKYAK